MGGTLHIHRVFFSGLKLAFLQLISRHGLSFLNPNGEEGKGVEDLLSLRSDENLSVLPFFRPYSKAMVLKTWYMDYPHHS